MAAGIEAPAVSTIPANGLTGPQLSSKLADVIWCIYTHFIQGHCEGQAGRFTSRSVTSGGQAAGDHFSSLAKILCLMIWPVCQSGPTAMVFCLVRVALV